MAEEPRCLIITNKFITADKTTKNGGSINDEFKAYYSLLLRGGESANGAAAARGREKNTNVWIGRSGLDKPLPLDQPDGRPGSAARVVCSWIRSAAVARRPIRRSRYRCPFRPRRPHPFHPPRKAPPSSSSCCSSTGRPSRRPSGTP